MTGCINQNKDVYLNSFDDSSVLLIREKKIFKATFTDVSVILRNLIDKHPSREVCSFGLFCITILSIINKNATLKWDLYSCFQLRHFQSVTSDSIIKNATYFRKLLVGGPTDEFSVSLIKMSRYLCNSGHNYTEWLYKCIMDILCPFYIPSI